MLFNSFSFLFLFLPLVVTIHATLAKYAAPRWSQGWLLVASLFFYGYANLSYVPLLMGSIVFNWGIARLMMSRQDEAGRKFVLRIGLASNIAFLCSFKYVNFLGRTVTALHGPHIALPDWAMPLGASFFTLTQVMYLVDTYQGLNGVSSLFDHATLVAMFPYVSSGPLVSARAVLPQFRRSTLPGGRMEAACRGLYLFALGLGKKVLLADSFAAVADAGFGSVREYSFLEAWVFAFAFFFQIYFDFSGYSDMAVGCGWLLGIDIPNNFNAPLRARSIREFWQRWHITLSNFITNYLFTPILRSMGRATLRTSAMAILLAMGIAGLWHGAAWTYVIFGLLHGAALAINQIWKKRKGNMTDWMGWAVTQTFVAFSLVFFRSPDVPSALHMVSRLIPRANMLGLSALNGVVPFSPSILAQPLLYGVAIAFLFRSSVDLAKGFRPMFRPALATAGLVLISLYLMNSAPAKQFLYFAF